MARSPARRSRGARRSPTTTPLLLAVVLWGVVAALALFLLGWLPYGAWLAGGTVATFVLFALDKRQAQAGGWRVPERLLLGLMLAGGVIGGLLGMLGLRHKTQHRTFWTVLWIALALHAGIVFWWVLRLGPQIPQLAP